MKLKGMKNILLPHNKNPKLLQNLYRDFDTEIAEYLAKEKGIVLHRTRINQIKKGRERQTEKW
jgi:hypothetical protein